MFLVLVMHANYFSLGRPTFEESANGTLPFVMRILIESICIICVNVFVLISGWFGIHFKWRSLANFLFQVFFFGVILYAFSILFFNTSFDLKGLLACFQITQWNWFVKAYLLLYLISPILNAFCETASKKQFFMVLSGFFVYQTIYGLSGSAKFIEYGFSTMSFIGLYLLAQFIRNFVIYEKEKSKIRWISFFIFFACVMLDVFLEYWLILINRSFCVFSYCNPLVIFESLSLITFCSTLSFQSRFINFVASSSFAVFLLHANINLCRPYFVPFVNLLYEKYSGISCLFLIFVFLIIVFALAIFLDQIRKLIWNFINARIST